MHELNSVVSFTLEWLHGPTDHAVFSLRYVEAFESLYRTLFMTDVCSILINAKLETGYVGNHQVLSKTSY